MHLIRPSQILLYTITLVVVLGGGAYLVCRQWMPRPGNGVLPSAGDALERVSLWMGDEDHVRILLRPCYQWPEADLENDVRLSDDLFPGTEGARFAVLWIFNYADEGSLTYDRETSPVAFSVSGGRRVRPLDLPSAVAAADLPPDIAFGLRVENAAERSVSIPPRSYRRVLIALPGDCPVRALEEVSVLGLDLRRHEIVRNRLENYLADPVVRARLAPGGS